MEWCEKLQYWAIFSVISISKVVEKEFYGDIEARLELQLAKFATNIINIESGEFVVDSLFIILIGLRVVIENIFI